MQRRRFLATVSIATMPLLSGCGDEAGDNEESETHNDDETSEPEDTEGVGNEGSESTDDDGNEDAENGNWDDDTEEENQETDTADDPNVEIVIEYDGNWSGEMEVDDTLDNISGSGDETINVEVAEDTTTVGVALEKDDSTDSVLTVELLVDGEVKTEGSVDSSVGNVRLTTTI